MSMFPEARTRKATRPKPQCASERQQTQGAMAYNMTSFQPIRDLLREIGGEEAAKTMPTPTFSVCVNEKGRMFVRVTAGEVIVWWIDRWDKYSDRQTGRQTGLKFKVGIGR